MQEQHSGFERMAMSDRYSIFGLKYERFIVHERFFLELFSFKRLRLTQFIL
ncbi:MAG: hypothetical protein ABSE08_21590 [Syntrophobacteraceae bacterium]